MNLNIKEPYFDNLLQKAAFGTDVLAVILFASKAADECHELSDIDICIMLMPAKYDSACMSHKKLGYLMEYDFDIHIFQQLPIYIRQWIIKEGRVLFCRDEAMLYKLAFCTAQEFEDYKHIYHDYLGKVANA